MEQRDILSPREFDGDYLTAEFVVARLHGRGLDEVAAPGSLAGVSQGARAKLPENVYRSDYDLSPDTRRKPPTALRPASVLVPLVQRDAGLTVLLTQRTAHLTNHAGQVSFPGGRQEPEDANTTVTALRETREEIGVPEANIQVIGRLDTYITGTGYRITPIVGLLKPPFPMAPDPNEVAEIFEVPLQFIVDLGNYVTHRRETEEWVRYFYALTHEERYIWGATAGMLMNLADILAPPESP
jgi:8-oxo-dGTP pyrophosphatase MutT (NUDIX family)